MDKGHTVIYTCKLMRFSPVLTPAIFGTKEDWARYFEKEKLRDNNLLGFVDFLINYGILIQCGSRNGYPTYRPSKPSQLKAQTEILEANEVFIELDKTYDLIRNPTKGSQLL
jgi:hypothetical protein